METNFNTINIMDRVKQYEDILFQQGLDTDYIATLVEQAEHLIYHKTGKDCLEHITNTYVEKIGDYFGLNVDKGHVKLDYRLTLEYNRMLAMTIIAMWVEAGCRVNSSKPKQKNIPIKAQKGKAVLT